MRVVTHGPIHKLHLTSTPFKFLDEQHLVDIVASQSIRSSDDHSIKSRTSDLFSLSIKTWPTEFGSTVAVIAKKGPFLPCPSLGFMILAQTVELLFDGLGLSLSLCRNADVDRNVHRDSPGILTPEWR